MLTRLVANAAALALATWLLHGISMDGGSLAHRAGVIVVVAIIFTLLNALVRPLIKLVSLPLIWLTLGLFLVVVNACMLMLTSAVAGGLGQPWHVAGWTSAVIGSLFISMASGSMGMLLDRDER